MELAGSLSCSQSATVNPILSPVIKGYPLFHHFFGLILSFYVYLGLFPVFEKLILNAFYSIHHLLHMFLLFLRGISSYSF